MNFDVSLPALAVDHLKHMQTGVEISPLPGPILTDVLFADNAATLGGLGSADVLTHKCKGAVDAFLIKAA